MAEDRKKMLEALVAKRKAEAEGGGRSAHKSKSSPLLTKPASAHKSSPLTHKPKTKPSPLLHQQKHQHHKKESPPKKKKRVEKYDTEEDDDEGENDSDENSDSEEEPVKKKLPRSATRRSSLKPSLFKGNPDTQGKTVVKESAKGKRKSKDSSDDDDVGSGDEDEEAAEADSGDEGLDTTRGSATRRSSLKPSLFKGNLDTKGKTVVKESAKDKRKSKDSSDDDDVGSGDEDEEAAEADSGDEGLDTTNILPARTRRRGSQPVHYDFTNMSGDDDDDSD